MFRYFANFKTKEMSFLNIHVLLVFDSTVYWTVNVLTVFPLLPMKNYVLNKKSLQRDMLNDTSLYFM